MRFAQTSRGERRTSRECPDCGSKNVTTKVAPDRFTYGTGPDAVELQVDVPFHRCGDCGFDYTDAEAESLRHEAVCRHLRVLAPSEIRTLRDSYYATRGEFAEATRIGVASLARWETGQLIQNPANDSLLYLLKFRDNWERLKARFKGTPKKTRIAEIPRRFESLDEGMENRKREEGRGFLRAAAR